MKPGNRPKFGKVPIPAAETPEDEASLNPFDSPMRRVFLLIPDLEVKSNASSLYF